MIVSDMDDDPRFFDLVGNVRAIRRLKPDPVPMEVMWKVLNTGIQAPSGQNTQPHGGFVPHGRRL